MRSTTDGDRFRKIAVAGPRIDLRFDEAEIDDLAFGFCEVLNGRSLPYAIVGGYVAIMLGRPRESEDVDLLCQPLDYARFLQLHRELTKKFECLTPGRPPRLFADYLEAGSESTALRYAKKGTFVPNVEFKFAIKPLDRRAVRLRMPVDANGRIAFVGPLGMQIGYKLYMGSPKDIEDAKWIYRAAGGNLDEGEIWRTAASLGIKEKEGRRILGAR